MCMARKNTDNPNLQCNRTVHKTTDFCKYHLRYGVYHSDIISNITSQIVVKRINNMIDKENKRLDNSVEHNLLGVVDTWAEVPMYRRCVLDGETFDSTIIAKHFTSQLNSSVMENPLPMYPSNPFNKQLITPESLYKLKSQIDNTHDMFNILYTFLSLNVKSYYDEALRSTNGSCKSLISKFNNSYRYKILNCKNSQDIYTGVWIDKNTVKSQFELMYEQYVNTPFQIVDCYGDIVTNPRKIYLKRVLDSMPSE